jgi:hypothetical protein
MKIFLLFVAIFIATVPMGCTKQAWFEGLKNREKQECYKYPNDRDVKNCLDHIGDVTIDDGRK